jgi:hypothetical protein
LPFTRYSASAVAWAIVHFASAYQAVRIRNIPS